MQNITPAKRVLSVLKGEIPKKSPFTIYETKLERSYSERELRNRGLCLVKRTRSYRIEYKGVDIKAVSYKDEKGRHVTRTSYYTPYGELYTVTESAGFTSWTHERMFKSPDDYKKLLYLFNNTVVLEAYDSAAMLIYELGDDFVIRDNLPSEPMQALISSYMGVGEYCMEWMDNRDEILKLYDALVKTAREIYPVVANGPLMFANYGGNVIPEVVGAKNFEEYFVPHYNEAAYVLHKKGKLIGCHLDGCNSPIMDAVAETGLDYIEAYDPGMSPGIKEALSRWPDKILWLNWPSANQLDPLPEVYNRTLMMLDEAGEENRLIMGITEDVPKERLVPNCMMIMKAIEDHDFRRQER